MRRSPVIGEEDAEKDEREKMGKEEVGVEMQEEEEDWRGGDDEGRRMTGCSSRELTVSGWASWRAPEGLTGTSCCCCW